MTATPLPYEAAAEQARTVLDASANLELDRLTRPGLAMLVGQLQQALRQLLTAQVTVYEARWDTEIIGRYATRAAARAACETDAAREPNQQQEPDDGSRRVLGWVPDHGGPDAAEDLIAFVVPPGPAAEPTDESTTGYTITPRTLET